MSEAVLDDWLAQCRARIEAHLEKLLPQASEPPQRLHEAMRAAVFSPGKRLRPALAFAAAEACGREPETVLPVAAAAELVHAYSLVHDDLPAMDDDSERRGRPTLHAVFGEAEAILAGDALLALGFAQTAQPGVPPDVVARLAHVAGSRQLVGGQADDLADRGGALTREQLHSIHQRKTAALFGFAIWGGARLCGADPERLAGLDRYAQHFGLAFQAVDDLLDDDPDECSILRVMSAAEARAEIAEHQRAAAAALASLPPGTFLARLAEAVSGRLP